MNDNVCAPARLRELDDLRVELGLRIIGCVLIPQGRTEGRASAATNLERPKSTDTKHYVLY
jgi:hypothetical protein